MDKMSAASRDHVMTVVGGALNWMNEQGYLKINVLFEYNKKEQDPSKLNQKNADQAIGFLDAPPLQSATNPMNNVSFIDALEEETEEVTFEAPGIQRYIPLHVWNEVVHYIDNLPKETVSQARGYHQMRWLIRGMYCTGARVHEFASHPMRSFVQNKQGLWYWVVIGKGGKRASVPVLDPLPEILTDYRQFLCKPEKITQSESTMITLNRTGNDDIKKRQVFALVKNLFNEVAETLDDEDDCNLLRGASPHWIRHSVITHLLDEGKSLEYVSRFARHSSIEMTRKYYHIDLTKIHDALNSSS